MWTHLLNKGEKKIGRKPTTQKPFKATLIGMQNEEYRKQWLLKWQCQLCSLSVTILAHFEGH